ncbi:hypothetical protein LIBO111022_09640 [Listeria booriae]|nr:Uncharacterised protein [Listeria booriae]
MGEIWPAKMILGSGKLSKIIFMEKFYVILAEFMVPLAYKKSM